MQWYDETAGGAAERITTQCAPVCAMAMSEGTEWIPVMLLVRSSMTSLSYELIIRFWNFPNG